MKTIARPEAATFPNWRTGAQKILILEDDPFWQKVIGRLLRAVPNPVELRFVRSVRRAENLIYLNTYDLIVFDHVLEGSGLGHDFFLNARKKGVATPMIMVSSIDFDKIKSLTAGKAPAPYLCSKMNVMVHLSRLASLALFNPNSGSEI